MIQFYLNLETFDFMNVAQFHIFLSAQANFPLISAMYLQKAKALQDEETGKRRLQDKPWWYFSCHQEEKKGGQNNWVTPYRPIWIDLGVPKKWTSIL